jgi:hypothetical protein
MNPFRWLKRRRRTGPPTRLTALQRTADLETLINATREPPCPDCTTDWLCRTCDPWYWIALEQTEGLQ